MKPIIKVLPDNDALARHVADLILEQAQAAVTARGRFSLVLTGGDSPVPLYRLLAEGLPYKSFPWEKTICLFGDERHVPPDDPDSNYLQAKKTLFHTGLIPEENIYRFHAEIPDPEKAAEDYEKTLRKLFPEKDCLNGFPRLDVLLLGLGANGHTASLFPCTKALHEKKRWVVANKVPELEKHRLTMSFPVLNASREIYLESIDPRINEAVTNVLKAEERDFYPFPVQNIAPVAGAYHWFLTEATAPTD
jgi:6-phosphogluconolactonase